MGMPPNRRIFSESQLACHLVGWPSFLDACCKILGIEGFKDPSSLTVLRTQIMDLHGFTIALDVNSLLVVGSAYAIRTTNSSNPHT